MSGPSEPVIEGRWFDGQIAADRPVTVRSIADGLLLTDGDGREERVEKSDLVLLERHANRLRLGHRGIDGWRLVLPLPIPADIEALLPRRAGALVVPASRRTMTILVSVMVALSLLAGVLVFAPHLLARHLPMSWERKIGAAYDLPANLTRCDDPAAKVALDALVDRLDPAARRDGFTVELLDVDMVNAAALPGGRMVIFRGLIDDLDEKQSVDALAGVMAHEIAHVRRRHVATAMVRQLGLGAIITAAGGGAIASNAGGLLSLQYGRGAEAEADRDAIAMLERAGIDPRPTARQFDRFGEGDVDVPEWMDSHPATGGRAATFRAAYRRDARYTPALDTARSAALLRACAD